MPINPDDIPLLEAPEDFKLFDPRKENEFRKPVGVDRIMPDGRTLPAWYILGFSGGMMKTAGPGNQNAKSVKYARLHKECVMLSRAASPKAMKQLIRLVDHKDPRIALVASEKLLERAWGKPKDVDAADLEKSDRKLDIKAVMKAASDEELRSIKNLLMRISKQQAEIDRAAIEATEGTDYVAPGDDEQPTDEVDYQSGMLAPDHHQSGQPGEVEILGPDDYRGPDENKEIDVVG